MTSSTSSHTCTSIVARLFARPWNLDVVFPRKGMTSATTVLGLQPIALGLGEGAELRTPTALTVIGGLIASTLLTLLVVPAVYVVLDRRARGGGAANRRLDSRTFPGHPGVIPPRCDREGASPARRVCCCRLLSGASHKGPGPEFWVLSSLEPPRWFSRIGLLSLFRSEWLQEKLGLRGTGKANHYPCIVAWVRLRPAGYSSSDMAASVGLDGHGF